MEKTTKNGIKILSQKDLDQMVRDREDRERQEGFCQDNELILQQQAIDRSYGKNGYSGRV